MNIILFGPPGSGKGTQADNLVKHFNLFKISVGDILRNEINQNSPIGKKIKSTIDEGGFVSDKIVNDLTSSPNFVFDLISFLSKSPVEILYNL